LEKKTFAGAFGEKQRSKEEERKETIKQRSREH